MSSQNQPILSLSHITKDFSGTRALDDVSFDLYAGEVHCLVGENGAGKSTLIKILSGAERPDAGEIVLFGERRKQFDPRESIRCGITTIYQDVDLVGSLSVADNIFLGGELKNRFGLVDSARQEREAREIIERINMGIDPREIVENLSAAQKQNLQIIKALHRDARIFIMDEPTSSLGQEETEALMDLIRSLTARGIGVIYISHYIREVMQIGDRITVLKDGQRVMTVRKEDCTIDAIVRAMVGRDARVYYNRERVPIGETLLEVRHFGRGAAVKDVSFDVRCGEIFGIGGMVGSGRTELANLIFGVDRKDTGELRLNGSPLAIHSPSDAIGHGICMIVEDRKQDGLFGIRPVLENIGVIQNERRGALLNLRSERMAVDRVVDQLRIHVASVDQDVESLSGGNQQKSILARWLLTNSSVLIFDEPTKGVDIGAKEEIYRFMVDLARSGKAIIMISSDLPELLSLSDRIGVMRDGEMVHVLTAAEATEESLMKEFLGLN